MQFIIWWPLKLYDKFLPRILEPFIFVVQTLWLGALLITPWMLVGLLDYLITGETK